MSISNASEWHDKYRKQGAHVARNIVADKYGAANTHEAQLAAFAEWSRREHDAEHSAAAIAAFREGLYAEDAT
jgi:hypothetical protein